MLKFIKFTFSFLILVLIILLVTPFFINVNDYKPEIKKAVFDATGRNLDIGNIKLSLFPWVGVTLTDVALENAEGFAQLNMLEVNTVDVKVALMPLFDQQVEVKHFELKSPKIWLTQHSDGSNNWSDLSEVKKDNADDPQHQKTQPSTKGKEDVTTSNQALPIAFEAKLLQLTHGQIIWNDESKGKVVIDDIQLDVTNLQLKQPVGIDFSARIGANPMQITAEVGPMIDLDKFNPETLPALVQVKSNNFSLKPFLAWLPQLEPEQEAQFGQLQNTNISLDVSLEQHADKMLFSSGSIEVNAKHKLNTAWKLNIKSLKTLKIDTFKLTMDDTDVLSMSGKVRSLLKKPRFEAKISTPKLQRIWLNTLLPSLQDIYKEHPKPWQTVQAEAFIAGDADIIEIRNMQLHLDEEPIQLSGDIAIGDAPDIQLRITANELHLDPWIPQSKKDKKGIPSTQAPSNTAATDNKVNPEPDLTFLKPWYLSVQLQAKTIHAMKLKLENLRMTLSSEKGVVRLNPLSFDTNGGHISENMTLYTNQYPATWKQSLRLEGVSIQPILKALADFDKLSGLTTLNADLSGKGLLPDNITKNVTGRGKFLFEDGQFKGVDIAKEVRKLKKQSSSTQKSDFAKMQGTFNIKNAILTNNDLYMASPLFRLSGKGKIYLDPAKVDYHVRPKLIKSLAGQGGDAVKKGLVVPLHISGPFDKIKVSVEMDKDAILDSAGALNDAAGKPIGGVGGKALDQGFVKTRDEEVAKAKAEAKRKAKAKIDAEKAQAEAKAKEKAKQKLKDVFKGFKF